MAYSESMAQKIREVFIRLKVPFHEKKMFSGVCYMVEDKMCCGTHVDKISQENLLLCRISEEDAERALKLPYVLPMNFTGRPMKGYIYVSEKGIEAQKDLTKWIQLCVDFNPKAKRSKK